MIQGRGQFTMINLLLSAFLVCIWPDPGTTNCPTIRWDPIENVSGHTIYWRIVGNQVWNKTFVVCREGVCPGRDPDLPLVRYIDQPAGEIIELCVRANTSFGESINCSNIISLCWPEVWYYGYSGPSNSFLDPIRNVPDPY